MTKIQVAKGITAVIIIIGSYAAGRYSVEVDKTVATSTDSEHIREVIQVHTVTTTSKEPNGQQTSTTTTDSTAKIKQQDTKTQEVTTTTPVQSKGLNVSIMVAPTSLDLRSPLTYGIVVTKQIIGPLTVGAFGLTNSTVGLTVGVNF